MILELREVAEVVHQERTLDEFGQPSVVVSETKTRHPCRSYRPSGFSSLDIGPDSTQRVSIINVMASPGAAVVGDTLCVLDRRDNVLYPEHEVVQIERYPQHGFETLVCREVTDG